MLDPTALKHHQPNQSSHSHPQQNSTLQPLRVNSGQQYITQRVFVGGISSSAGFQSSPFSQLRNLLILEPSRSLSDARQRLTSHHPQSIYQPETPSLILARYLAAISPQGNDTQNPVEQIAVAEEVIEAEVEIELEEEEQTVEQPISSDEQPSAICTPAESIDEQADIPLSDTEEAGLTINHEALKAVLRACFEECYGHMEEFEVSEGECMFICEQLYKSGLYSLSNPTTVKQAYRIFQKLRDLQHSLEQTKPKRYIRDLPKMPSGMGASNWSITDSDTYSDTESIASSTTSSASKATTSSRALVKSKVKQRFQHMKSMKKGDSLPNPLRDSDSENDDTESPQTEAYFDKRSKKNIGSASADAVGAVASLATQVNITAGVRSIHGQLRTRSHLSRLRKLKTALKAKMERIEPIGQEATEQLLRYEDLLHLCKQIISVKKAKSIEQSGTTASAFIPVVISGAGRVVGGAAKAAATAYQLDTHILSTIAQKLHGHANAEMKAWLQADFGCYVEVPGLAIMRELFAHITDSSQVIIQQKTLAPMTNERIQLVNELAMEPNGWTVVMDKLGLK